MQSRPPYCPVCNDSCVDQNDPTGQADCGSCGGSFAWRLRQAYYASAYATPIRPPLKIVTTGHYRMGTAKIERKDIFDLIGEPTHDWRENDPNDGKVKLVWVFETPRGIAELRDYWWNGPAEWSIASNNVHAARFLAKYLRVLGVPASTRFNYEKDCKLFS